MTLPLVFHERKTSLRKLIRVTYLSGIYRTFGFVDSKKTLKFWFFIPQIFLVGLASAFFFNLNFGVILLCSYLLFITSLSLYHCHKINKIFQNKMGKKSKTKKNKKKTLQDLKNQ